MTLGLVLDHIQQAAVGDRTELLVINSANIHRLLPAGIQPDNHLARIHAQALLNQPMTNLVEVSTDLAVASARFGLDVAVFAVTRQLSFEFVVVGVDRLDCLALDQNMSVVLLSRNDGYKVVDTKINAKCVIRVQFSWRFYLFTVDTLDHEGCTQWHNPHIIYDGFVGLAVVRLVLAASDFERLETKVLTASQKQPALLDLMAVATDYIGFGCTGVIWQLRP